MHHGHANASFRKGPNGYCRALPLTKNGNKYLLTLQDNLTKYSDAIPLANIEVAVALAEQFISRFGCPRAIHTDQGRNFVGQVMKTFCQIFRIQRVTSTAFYPQSLGSLERAHRVFLDYLSIIAQKVIGTSGFDSVCFHTILQSMKPRGLLHTNWSLE